MSMNEITVSNIDNQSFNQFGANDEELIANALEDAGLLTEHTIISGKPAKQHLKAFFAKRDNFRESTMLGNLLVLGKVITVIQLNEALEYKRQHPELRLGETLIKLNLTTKEAIERAVSEQTMIREDIQELDVVKEKIDTIKDRLRKYMPF